MQTVPITIQAQRESGGVHTHNLDYSLVKVRMHLALPLHDCVAYFP